MENEKNSETVQLTQDELKTFIDALTESVVKANFEAMQEVFESVLPPFMQRVEGIAQGQITLAAALNRNRRDANATEFAKLLIERAMRTDEGIDVAALHTIPAQAYALANEMDMHGRVAEVQAPGKDEMANKHIADNPRADSKTLVESFFGRGIAPKSDGSKPGAKKSGGEKGRKH